MRPTRLVGSRAGSARIVPHVVLASATMQFSCGRRQMCSRSSLPAHLGMPGSVCATKTVVSGARRCKDLLAEEITRIVTGIVRLSVQRRAPQAWSFVADVLGDLRGADYEDAAIRQKIEGELRGAITDLGQFLGEQAPAAKAAAELVVRTLRFIDLGAVARIYPEYGSDERLEIAAEGISLYMQECAESATTWLEMIDEFEGVEQVPLMTVHKSKGLEYDTILFVGLDEKMWWSHNVGDYEGRATFFVALSRAKQRTIFTYCKTRGSRKGVSDLYDLLSAAGVPEKRF
jgi:superfamily I DNA/RNA helicase